MQHVKLFRSVFPSRPRLVSMERKRKKDIGEETDTVARVTDTPCQVECIYRIVLRWMALYAVVPLYSPSNMCACPGSHRASTADGTSTISNCLESRRKQTKASQE